MTPTPIQLSIPASFNFNDTSLEQAQANTLFAVKAQVASLNSARVTEYNTQFDRYTQQMNERPDATNIVAPVPATSVIVAISDSGWPSVAPGTEHVCPTKVWAPVKTTAQGWFTAGSSTPTPDPFQVPLFTTVDHTGMKFLRVA